MSKIDQKELDFNIWLEEPHFPNIVDKRAQNHAKAFIEKIKSNDFPRPLYNHQRKAILKVLYYGEVLGSWSVLLDIVTGGGKTVIIASLVAYFWQVHNVEKFLIITPNTIVRERVKDDFDTKSPEYAYINFPLFFNSYSKVPEKLVSKVLRERADSSSIRDANVIVANIHQLYEGKDALEMLLSASSTPDLIIFNDEAHNAAAREYREVLKLMQDKTRARIDLTATPLRLDKQDLDTYPPIYTYQIQEATRDKIVKQTLVTKPDISVVKLQYEEWDDENNVVRTLSAQEMPWDQIESTLKKSGAVKFVTANHARKQQLKIAQQCLEYQQKTVPINGGERIYEPLMMVVALSQKDAWAIYQTLIKDSFGYKPEEILLVHSKQDETENKKAFLLGRTSPEGLSNEDADLWQATRKVKIIIGIGMLREGWDVRNISVICLFRKFSYQKKGDMIYTVYGPQIIGRGLRKINRGNKIDHLFVVDHPAYDHNWLWELMGAEQYAKPLNPGDEIDQEIIDEIDKTNQVELNEDYAPAQEGDNLKELDLEDILSSIPNAPDIEPVKSWQEHFKNLNYNKKISSAFQKITNIKTKAVGSKNTAHELPIDAINTPEDINEIANNNKLTIDEKRKTILSDLEELPRQVLYQRYKQITAEELKEVNDALIWILKNIFLINGLNDIYNVNEAKINKLYFALPNIIEELYKPEVIMSIIGEK